MADWIEVISEWILANPGIIVLDGGPNPLMASYHVSGRKFFPIVNYGDIAARIQCSLCQIV